LQQNGAPPFSSNFVQVSLNETFPSYWIGRIHGRRNCGKGDRKRASHEFSPGLDFEKKNKQKKNEINQQLKLFF
jgi:hypothetical protein